MTSQTMANRSARALAYVMFIQRTLCSLVHEGGYAPVARSTPDPPRAPAMVGRKPFSGLFQWHAGNEFIEFVDRLRTETSK
jgi:hypothetical protein